MVKPMWIVKDVKIVSGLVALVLAGYCPNLVSLEIGEQAPNFKLAVLSDSQTQDKILVRLAPGKGAYRLVELRDYAGAVVYVDFWASYCLPCRESFPLLSELRDRFNRQTFEVIAVSNDVDPRDAKRLQKPIKYLFQY